MFRSLFSLPSFTGYLCGLSFTRGAAYALAANWRSGQDEAESNRRYLAHYEHQIEVRRQMMIEGKLPWPWETPALAEARRRRQLGLPAIPARSAVVAHTPKATFRGIPARSRPAAVTRNGGLRGSLATRGRL